MPRSLCLAALIAASPPAILRAQTPAPAVFESSRSPASPDQSATPASDAPATPAPPAPTVPDPATADQPADRPLPASVKLGQTLADLFLRDGRVFSGTLVEHDGRTITLRISGIDTRFAAAEVDRIRFTVPPAELFAKLKAAIPENDPDSLVRLINWLAQRGQIELAAQELDLLLARSPDNVRARALQIEVARQLGLRRDAAAEDPEPAQEPQPPGGVPATRVPPLSAEQINLIKVFELDLASNPIVSIPREVMSRALDAKAGHPLAPASREARDAVLRATPVQQIELLFKLRAREFYPDVKVHGSPPAMRKFADDVQRPFLLGGCATSECHGGTEAGRLILGTQRPTSDATLYTNFYILDNFRTAAGQPLINWQEPDQSLFLQMGLPREFATAKHPPVPRGPGGADSWRPVIRSTSEQRFKNAVAWIRSMYQPRPDYGLTYQPLRPFTAQQEARREPDPGR